MAIQSGCVGPESQDGQLQVTRNTKQKTLTPLNLIHFALCCCVCQDRIFDGSRHLLNVPDQRLVVVASCADVAGRVRCPSDAVDARPVVRESSYRRAGNANVEDDDFAGVHRNGGEVVRVLLVPG